MGVNQTKEQASPAVVLAESADVMATLGTLGDLAPLFQSSNSDGPIFATHLIPNVRCDVLLQRLTAGEDPAPETPPGSPDHLRQSIAPVTLPDDAALLVSSLSDALETSVMRVRGGGPLVRLPAGYRNDLDVEEMAWLDEHCEAVEDELERLAQAIIDLAHELTTRNIEWVIYNVSTFVPGEKTVWHRPGEPEPLGVRAHRLDLLVEEVAPAAGVAVVDVDRLAAEYGAGAAIGAGGEYTAGFAAVVSGAAQSVIASLPMLSRRFGPDAMHLVLPRYDRRTERGVVERWAVEAGSGFAAGDELFVAKFDELATRLDGRTEPSLRSMRLSVIATRPGHLRSRKSVGAAVDVGDVVGVITTDASVVVDDGEISAVFPTGVRVHEG